MINVFVVNDQEAVVRFGKVLQIDNRVLLIVFVQVGFDLFGYVAGKDCGFYTGVSFGKQNQHGFVNIIVNQDNALICVFNKT